MRFNHFFVLFILSITFQAAKAQSKFSFMPGLYYNGSFLDENVSGMGLSMGVEYQQHKEHFFSIELRTRYGFYSFDDGTKWTEKDGRLIPPIRDKARLEYRLFSSQVGVVPKFHFHLFEELSLFLENEFAVGLMAGSFKYGGEPYAKKKFTEPVFSYNIAIGAEYREWKYPVVGSIGYSTLNFRDKIKKHQPQNYQGWIPDQNAGIIINIILKVPLGK
jgi:hypothetical protein